MNSAFIIRFVINADSLLLTHTEANVGVFP